MVRWYTFLDGESEARETKSGTTRGCEMKAVCVKCEKVIKLTSEMVKIVGATVLNGKAVKLIECGKC